jgi:predicted TIM-barrel fold metal-dependent hydrolase
MMASESENNPNLRTIALEEHFAIPEYMEGPGRGLMRQSQMARVIEQLLEIGDRRIAEMDAAGIDMQVLSLNSPGVEQLEPNAAVNLARKVNDSLAEASRRYPTRLAGFAALPTAVPDIAAGELERAVKELGLKGAVINGHTHGRYLDDPFFWPILERAEALQAPIYLHPAPPPQPVIEASYTGNFSPEVAFALSTSFWGWHIETATHILRMILGGVFDRFPRLQFIIGHMGEGLPFFLPRFDLRLSPQMTGLERPISAYLRENLSYTFGGFNFTPTFLDLLLQMGAERILFSADYPYESMAKAREFLEALPISSADRQRIAHGNAEKLLRL